MTTLRRLMIALLSAAMLAVGAANAASTTNYSDQWWVASEDGWGASVLQQWDVLFIDIFVYGADSKPTWFTAAAFRQANAPAGHDLFTGDLYATTGPYYGGAFNPGAVGRTIVGTLTFDATTVTTATLTYTVSGTPVVKNVTRQTWRNENLGGSYYGGFVWDYSGCRDPADNDHFEVYGPIQITHSSTNAVQMTMQIVSIYENGTLEIVPAGASATITGPYTQSGHVGQVQGTFSFVVGPESGSMPWNVFEIERTINGVSGRFNATDSGDGCNLNGRFAGVRR